MFAVSFTLPNIMQGMCFQIMKKKKEFFFVHLKSLQEILENHPSTFF